MSQITKQSVLKSYRFPLILLASIAVGCVIGVIAGEKAVVLKPFGDVFLNLIFTLVVPIVFFSISSSIASMVNLHRLGKILLWMLIVFVVTGLIASVIMIGLCKAIPPVGDTQFELDETATVEPLKFSEQVVNALTVSDFPNLISRSNMLPLILFTIFFGAVTASFGEKAASVIRFLNLMAEIFLKMVNMVMYYTPIGLGAYFAYLVGDLGPQLIGTYTRTVVFIYLPACIVYFVVFFALYTYVAGGKQGVKTFFKNALNPVATSLATQSSIATLPVNLTAAERIGVPKDIREIVLPIGATMHMDGTCFSSILKITVMFGIFGRPFEGIGTYVSAILISIMCGMVMSGVPGGGLIGEALLMSIYGFPASAYPIIVTIGFLVDAPATMINAVGDTVAAMLVTRFVEGKDWLERKLGKKTGEPAEAKTAQSV